jgi:hypothetical protein
MQQIKYRFASDSIARAYLAPIDKARPATKDDRKSPFVVMYRSAELLVRRFA